MANKQIEGMFVLIDHGNENGFNHLTDELRKRNMPAVVIVGESVLNNYSELRTFPLHEGIEVGAQCGRGPFWNEPYQYQFEEIRRIKDKFENTLHRTLRVINSENFAYDENTLKAADAIGIEYVFGRGIAGAKAVVYKPQEYNVKIISVSNVPSEKMGTGSLCDYSLWSRGESPDGFNKILSTLDEQKIVLVSHSHIGGVKLHWWETYRSFLDSDKVAWKSLDEFCSNPIELANERIPLNTEVQYRTPQPRIPLEQEPDL